MQYSLLVKTDFGVLSCKIEFLYDENESRFTDIKIANLAADIEYRVDQYFPIKNSMKIEGIDLFNSSAEDPYASDIYINISKDNKIICMQGFNYSHIYWNSMTIENDGTYELTENV